VSRRVRLTRRGWNLVGAAIGLVIGSRLLGTVELAVLGFGAVALLLLSAGWLAGRRPLLVARRTLRPSRGRVGEEHRADLDVANRGNRTTPFLAVADLFDEGLRAARFNLAPLPPSELARAAYRIPTPRRGRFRVGPLVAGLTDPFGLAQRRWELLGADELLVWPRIHDVRVPEQLGGRVHSVTELGPEVSQVGDGDEFLTLREYEQGDDLRRVHWRSTARTGRMMIRQHEARRHARALVILDVRPECYDEESFEQAVEAAGSIVHRLARARRRVEMVTSAGESVGGERFEPLMDRLAVIEPHGPDRLDGIVADKRPAGLVIAVLGTIDERLARLLYSRRTHGPVIAVATRPSEIAVPGVTVVDASVEPFPSAWNRSVIAWRPVASSRLRG